MSRVPAELSQLEAALEALPIFPLPEVVFFPGVKLPLHVFEPRYRAMIADCRASHGAIAIAQLLPGQDAAGFPRIAKVVGAGIITEHQSLADGRSNILVEGLARVEIEELPFVAPYRRAQGKILVDAPSPAPESERAALVSAATAFAREVRKHDRSFALKLPDDLGTAVLADVCAFQLVVDATARQRILEEVRPSARVRLVVEELMVQAAALAKPSGDTRSVN